MREPAAKKEGCLVYARVLPQNDNSSRVPQRLKPPAEMAFIGTAEAVP